MEWYPPGFAPKKQSTSSTTTTTAYTPWIEPLSTKHKLFQSLQDKERIVVPPGQDEVSNCSGSILASNNWTASNNNSCSDSTNNDNIGSTGDKER